MSHTDSCPEPYEARRTGERAFERGSSGYYLPFDCDEANYEFRRGYKAAQHRHEMEEEEERSAARRRESLRQEEESGEYYGAEQEMVAFNGCQCDIPNAGLPLTGDETCRVCGRPV